MVPWDAAVAVVDQWMQTEQQTRTARFGSGAAALTHRRKRRRLLQLVSEHVYPEENRFFREQVCCHVGCCCCCCFGKRALALQFALRPHHYLEHTFTATNYPPYLGRLYISNHRIAFYLGGMFSNTSVCHTMSDVRTIVLDGYSITITLAQAPPLTLTLLHPRHRSCRITPH